MDVFISYILVEASSSSTSHPPIHALYSTAHTHTEDLNPSQLVSSHPVNMPKPNYSGSGYSGEDRRVYQGDDQRTSANSTLVDMHKSHPGNFLEALGRSPGKKALPYLSHCACDEC